MADLLSPRRLAVLGLTLAGAAAVIVALRIGLWSALVLYGAMASLLVATLLVLDRPGAVLLAVTAVTLGPLAGPVMLLAAAGPARRNIRIAVEPAPEVPVPTGAELICGEIAEGRRPLARSLAMPSLAEIFTSGKLADQQTALAAIVRQYSPELRAALNLALASDIPAVRAQAAAVFAHLRDTFATRARALAAGETGLSGAELEAEIGSVVASGFIDPATLTDIQRPAGCSTSKASTALADLRLQAVRT